MGERRKLAMFWLVNLRERIRWKSQAKMGL
jgi:hypothetical protein